MAPIGRTPDESDEQADADDSEQTDSKQADTDESDDATETDDPADAERPGHLREVNDGSGCVELWERLSEKRE